MNATTTKPKKPDLRKRTTELKPTNDELEKRIEAVELMMSRSFRRGQIHEAMAKRYGVHWRTADRYVVRAKQNLLKRLQKPKQDHLVDALGVYESIIRSADSRPMDKIRARQRIDELLGLDAPKRHELSGPEGEAIPVRQEPAEITQDEIDELLRVHFRERVGVMGGNGSNGGNGHGRVAGQG